MSALQGGYASRRRTARLLGWTLSLAALGLTGCPQANPTEPVASVPAFAAANDLQFDMRYYDSIEMTPRSPRTERELAIFIQLQRLHMAQPYHNKQGQVVPMAKQPTDSVYEQIGTGQKARGFASKEALLTDIYRKIDSLKALEHLSVTPQ